MAVVEKQAVASVVLDCLSATVYCWAPLRTI